MKQASHLDRIAIGPDIWVGANVTVIGQRRTWVRDRRR